MTSFSDKISNALGKKLPFAVFRKPNCSIVSGFFQQNKVLFFTKNFTESGFVFAPFDNTHKAVLIPENQSDFFEEKIDINQMSRLENSFSIHEIPNQDFIILVEKAIENIRKSKFEKVVVSRKEEIEIASFNLVEVYQKLLQKYKNAFVYVWYHPKVGLWLGATPETLLNISGNAFETMSLAGTQVHSETKNVIWKTKEIEEQLLVTNFIKNQLTSITSELNINDRETVRAGNLLHLRTKVSGKLIPKTTSLKKLIEALHPTPAVCGFPRNITKEFILKEEQCQRSFYTGFLGELNLQSLKAEVKNLKSDVGNRKSSLFVNLRCMEIKKNTAQIYVGGGITKDSDPGKEWEETVSKSKIMKAVL